MLDSSDADRRRKRIGRLGRGANFLHELLGVLRHRLQAPGWLEASQKDVGNRGDDVKMLRAWEQVQKQEDKRCMGPKPNARQKGKERSRRCRPGRPGPVPMFAGERGRNLRHSGTGRGGTHVTARRANDVDLRGEHERGAVVRHVGDHHCRDDHNNEQPFERKRHPSRLDGEPVVKEDGGASEDERRNAIFRELVDVADWLPRA